MLNEINVALDRQIDFVVETTKKPFLEIEKGLFYINYGKQ
jgi:hypothetical protein